MSYDIWLGPEKRSQKSTNKRERERERVLSYGRWMDFSFVIHVYMLTTDGNKFMYVCVCVCVRAHRDAMVRGERAAFYNISSVIQLYYYLFIHEHFLQLFHCFSISCTNLILFYSSTSRPKVFPSSWLLIAPREFLSVSWCVDAWLERRLCYRLLVNRSNSRIRVRRIAVECFFFQYISELNKNWVTHASFYY
jgi:hypothetical protein